MPQGGQTLIESPSVLQGVYEILTDDPQEGGPLDAWVKPCFYFEKLDDGQLLVSEEIRFHERDFGSIKTFLAQEKAAGRLISYSIGERCILYTTASDSVAKQSNAYIPMVKSGAWYILTRTQQPTKMFRFDSQNAVQTDMRVQKGDDGLLPGTDTLSMERETLVARQKDGAFFFNTREKGKPGWSLIYCAPDASGDLLLKVSALGEMSDTLIENNRAHYEAITHFKKIEDGNYLLNPNDQALDALLADQHLFGVMRLRKIKD